MRQVWAAGAAIGFLVGIGHASWQVSVESGQVLAGIVSYPAGNPFHIYHLKLWTLVNQLSAGLLRAGVSEIGASYVVSGLLGAVSFSALALVVFALCGARVVSVLAALFIHLTPAPQYGVSYPIWLLGVSHTYGVLGLSFDLLVVAVLGCGRYGAGLFLLGLAPAVHPSLGAWLWLLVAAVFVVDTSTRRAFVAHWRWFGAGAVLTAASAAFQWLAARGATAPAVDVAPYFDTFIREWDAHRQPIALRHHGLFAGLGTGLLAVLALRRLRRELPDAARFLLLVLAACSLLAVLVLGASAAGTEHLPRGLLVLMPNRLVNLDVLASTAVLLGLLWRFRATAWGRAGLIVLLGGLLLAPRSRYLELGHALGLTIPPLPWERLHVLAAAAILLLVAAWRSRPGEHVQWWRDPPRAAALAILASAPLLALAVALRQPRDLKDRTNNRLFAELARGEGLIAPAAGLHLIQLRTRRPVVLDAAGLDMLPYAWEAAPEMARILEGVYGIDFFHPPAEARRSSVIPFQHNRAVWEGRGTAEWQAVRREFGIENVLTHRDWDLQLPAGAGNKDYLIYSIPD